MASETHHRRSGKREILLDLQQIGRLGGFEDPAIREIIARFLHNLDAKIVELKRGAAEGNRGAVARLAFEIHAASLNCGFVQLAELAGAMTVRPEEARPARLEQAAQRARRAWSELFRPATRSDAA